MRGVKRERQLAFGENAILENVSRKKPLTIAAYTNKNLGVLPPYRGPGQGDDEG
jgi:hypothetical protein